MWLWMTGAKHVPASSAGVFTVFLPISAATVGMLIYGEQFTFAQAAAFALALVGVVLATLPGRARADGAARGRRRRPDAAALALARQRHAVAERQHRDVDALVAVDLGVERLQRRVSASSLGRATLPPQRTLSIAIRPPGRSSTRQRS